MKVKKSKSKIKNVKETRSIFPEPKKVKCFKCKKTFEVKYVVPNKSYSKKNNWEYWTNPNAKDPNFWKDKEARKKDRYICNSDLLEFYYDKETYWETIADLRRRAKLTSYIFDKTISA